MLSNANQLIGYFIAIFSRYFSLKNKSVAVLCIDFFKKMIEKILRLKFTRLINPHYLYYSRTNLFKLTLLVIIGGFLFFSSCTQPQEPSPEPVPTAEETEPIVAINPEKVTGRGRVEPEGRIIPLYPKTAGTITSVNARMGSKVKKGTVLFVIENSLSAANKNIIHAQIKAARADIQLLEVSLQKAKTSIEITEKTYARLKEVYEQGAGTKKEVDDAANQSRLLRLEVPAIEAQINKGNARIEELNARLKMEDIRKADYFIRAPADGLILDLKTTKGMQTQPGTSLADFAVDSPVNVLTEIDELFASMLALDQSAFIRITGQNDTIASGKVIELSPSLRRKSIFSEEIGLLEDRRVRIARIRIEEGQENLLFGQRVECLIDVKTN